jgi:hypothetical protein
MMNIWIDLKEPLKLDNVEYNDNSTTRKNGVHMTENELRK